MKANKINRLFPHGPHIITKNNLVSLPTSLNSFSSYFLFAKDGIMSKHRRLLVHIKWKMDNGNAVCFKLGM